MILTGNGDRVGIFPRVVPQFSALRSQKNKTDFIILFCRAQCRKIAGQVRGKSDLEWQRQRHLPAGLRCRWTQAETHQHEQRQQRRASRMLGRRGWRSPQFLKTGPRRPRAKITRKPAKITRKRGPQVPVQRAAVGKRKKPFPEMRWGWAPVREVARVFRRGRRKRVNRLRLGAVEAVLRAVRGPPGRGAIPKDPPGGGTIPISRRSTMPRVGAIVAVVAVQRALGVASILVILRNT